MSPSYSHPRSEVKTQQFRASPANSLKYLFQKRTDTKDIRCCYDFSSLDGWAVSRERCTSLWRRQRGDFHTRHFCPWGTGSAKATSRHV